MKRIRESWGDLDLKTKIAYCTAVAAFVFGWGLTIAGFIVPPVGMVTDSVLWILGQALVYAASVFGVAMYTTGSVKGMKREISHFIEEEHNRANKPEIEEEIYEQNDNTESWTREGYPRQEEP